MGSDVESDPNSIPILPLFSMALPPHLHDYDHEPSGMLTPPLQTTASVPFRWEEQPGKPRPCTDLILHTPTPPHRCLDLPPRLAILESTLNINTKTPSPTTVLDGKSVLSSSSFRFARERRRRTTQSQRQGSFDSSCSDGWSPNDDNAGGQQQLLLLGNKNDHHNYSTSKGLFGSFRLKGTHKSKPSSSTTTAMDDVKGSLVISPASSSSIETGFFEEKKGKRMRRNSSLSKVTRSHFWATIYEGFKHVVPWKKKAKKETFII